MAESRYSDTVRVRQRRRDMIRRARTMRWAPLAAVLFPILPAPVYLLFGSIAGALAGLWQGRADGMREKPEPPAPQKFATREDSGPPQSLYLGQSMPFITYKSGIDQLRQEYGTLPEAARRAYDNGIIRNMSPLFVGDKNLCSHVCVTGSPGQGKTELLLSVAYQQINRGGSIVIVDPKADEELWLKIAEIATRANREQDLRYFNPDRAMLSHSYNPLLHGGARHIVSTGMKLTKTPTGGDGEFFYRMTRIGMLAAVVCLKAQPNWTPVSFKDLAPLFSDLPLFIRLWRNIPAEQKEAREFVYQFLSMWTYVDKDGVMRLNENKYKEILLGLKSMVMDYCHSEYAGLINTYTPDIEMQDVLENGRIFYAGFSALTDKQGSNVFGRLMMADLARAVGEIYRAEHRPATPSIVYMDEYSSSADEADSELLQTSRAANVAFMLNIHGRGFLDSVNENFMSKVLDTTANHLFLRVAAEESRKAAAQLAGSTITRFSQDATGQNFSKGHRNFESGLFTNEGHGRSVSTGTREMREELIQPEDLSMEKGDGILINSTGAHRMRLPLVQTTGMYRDTSEVNLPHFRHRSVKGLNLMESSIRGASGRRLAALADEE